MSKFTLNPVWNHHKDGGCGVVRFGFEGHQFEGYYSLYNDIWKVSLYDSLGSPARGSKRAGWSRTFVKDFRKKREAIEALVTLIGYLTIKEEIASEIVPEVTEEVMLSRLGKNG